MEGTRQVDRGNDKGLGWVGRVVTTGDKDRRDGGVSRGGQGYRTTRE